MMTPAPEAPSRPGPGYCWVVARIVEPTIATGLVVTPAVGSDSFVLTHERSGLMLPVSFADVSSATQAARLLASTEVDWTAPADEISALVKGGGAELARGVIAGVWPKVRELAE